MTGPRSAAPFGAFERGLAGRYLVARRAGSGTAVMAVIAMTGVAFAVWALIVIVSVMNGFRETLLNHLLGVGGHIYVDARGMPPEDLDAALARIRQIPGVRQAAPMVEGQALATSADGRSAGALVRGAREQDLRAMPFIAERLGSAGLTGFSDPEDPKLLLGTRIGIRLGTFQGDVVTLLAPNGADTPFGVLPRKRAFTIGALVPLASQYDDVLIYMPLEEAQSFFKRGDRADQIEIRIENPSNPRPVRVAIERALGDPTLVSDWKDLHESLVTALMVERNMMRLLLMVLVLLTGTLILSAMIMLVKNKGRDIAILRTMGATRGAILRIFLMAGATLGLAGGLLGLFVGVVTCLNIESVQAAIEFVTRTPIFAPEVYQLTRLPAKIDWGEVGLTFGWTLFVSCVATLPPAYMASLLDPVEALRHE